MSTLKESASDPAAVDAMSPGAVFAAMVDRALARQQELRSAELRRMLGCWVSELEPSFVIRHDGHLAGLTIDGARNPDGTTPLYVLSQYVDPADPYGSREAGHGSEATWYVPGDKVELDIRP
ncbi:hypothetical protein [Methylobacterium sp. WL7]|uniref:hypothetical protein n=1 Tax=Methylobacterium sp. WL7 TaxID=2603900 RepID=UPI0011C909CB|nr:hypothetical protein [Methylobacterium sp. WL7]TXN47339.1 hypothetical protein FV233_04735 [Methylobacterium sp. WL7]